MGIFADLFTDMMPASVTVESITGIDKYGAPTYGPPKSYVARVNTNVRSTIGPEGQLVAARGRAWLDTVDTINANDRITFSGSEVPAKILNVNVVPDETGPAYTSLDFQ